MKPFAFLIALTSLFIVSCSTDVILYDDYKEIPVVYGFIDYLADTNFIKITKAFYNDNDHPIDAYQAALVYDSSNYPGKLDAFFEELKSVQGQPFQPTGRILPLDTVTIHNKKEGLFYSPNQLLYYTTDRFNTNQGDDKYRYKLHVAIPDHDTVTAVTSVVSGDVSVLSGMVSFQSRPTHLSSYLLFSPTEEATLYEISMQFNYTEIHPGQPTEKKEISWSYGTKPLGAYEKVWDDGYKLYYSKNILFEKLEAAIGNDTVWDENHPNVIRYIDDFFVTISAAGEDFYSFYQYTQVSYSSLTQSNGYSNINGGWGLLSSRIRVHNKVLLSVMAKYDLFGCPWGFREN